jgi:V/A-type H+-transporting ATPase subunit E
MGLEEVKEEILQEAEDKASDIVEEAEAEKIKEQAEEEAEEIREKHEEELEQKKESVRKQGLSNARMKSKEEKLRAREESLSEVFEAFEDRLEDLDEEERESFVKSCLDKVEFDVGKIVGSSEFEDAVDVDFEEKEGVKGIVVVSEDETRRQSFTFDKIIQQFRDEYRKQVAEKLF